MCIALIALPKNTDNNKHHAQTAACRSFDRRDNAYNPSRLHRALQLRSMLAMPFIVVTVFLCK